MAVSNTLESLCFQGVEIATLASPFRDAALTHDNKRTRQTTGILFILVNIPYTLQIMNFDYPDIAGDHSMRMVSKKASP